MREHHQLVAAERDRLQPLVGRLERQDAEIEAALEQLGGDLPRRHAPDLDARLRVLAREALDDRQQRVDRRLVRADDDPPAADLLQLAHRRLGLGRQPQQPRGVVLQQRARLGQRAVARRPVEELVPELVLEPPDGLADGRLGAVQLLGRLGEAPLGRDGDEGVRGPAAAFGAS